jgi:tripartite-type tricarboxylate transporter receptor subunit TctC
LIASALAMVAAPESRADNFYEGKTVRLLIGFSAGGEYDLHARLVARHIGRHIPGRPDIVPENMTGAGGITMANHLFNAAPRDGTAMGMMVNTLHVQQAIGLKGLRLDADKFNWIGALAPTIETLAVWKTSRVRSIEDARKQEAVIGAVGRGGITYTFPAALNRFAGTKFKIVTGYPGGNDVNLAMQRGEVDGRNNTFSSWRATRRDWLENGDIKVIVYAGPPTKGLEGTPSLEELATTPQDRRIIRFLMSGTGMGRPIAMAPGAPAERVKIMRDAYLRLADDKVFLAEAEKLKVEVDLVSGEKLQAIVAEALATPPDLIELAKPLLQ